MSSPFTTSSFFDDFCLRKTDIILNLLFFPSGAGGRPFRFISSSPVNLAERKMENTAADLDRRNDGSLSMRLAILPTSEKLIEKEEEAEEEVEVTVAEHEQGRRAAQSGQRAARRSVRQTGQIPDRRRLDGCCGHFHTSSSSA
uniref:Uncharacterized protein n=1 Tax=Opuntia streptacantha TaxID=393608 RepID=A0A7C9CTU5_OPUST